MSNLASIWRRFFAVLIDGVIVGALSALFFLILLGEGQELYSQLHPSHRNLGKVFLIGTAFMIPFIIYEGVLLQLGGQTAGKAVMNICVVRIDGNHIKPWQAWIRPLIRVLFRWISILNYGPAFLTREKICVHDLLAGTRVIRCSTRKTAARDVLDFSSPLFPERAQWVFWVKWILVSTIGWTLGAISGELVTQTKLGAPVIQGVIFGGLVGTGIGTLQWLALRRHVTRAWWWILATVLGWAVSWPMVDNIESNVDTVRLFVTLTVAWGADIAAGLSLHWITGWSWNIGLHKALSPAVFWSATPWIAMAVPGAVVGLIQWPILRRVVLHAGWWVLPNALAFSAAAAVGFQSANNRRIAGALLGIALVLTQSLLLRWNIIRSAWWVAVCTLVFSMTVVVFEGDLTFAILFGTITGIALLCLLRQPRTIT